MENATKALLIAAAVLVVILLITFGVGILNTSTEQVGNIDLSEYQIQQFNDKFTKYNGTNVSGSEVNAMLKTVFNHNQVQEDNTTMVTVGPGTSAGTNDVLKTTATTIPTQSIGSRYTVQCQIDTNSKIVKHIQLTENTNAE